MTGRMGRTAACATLLLAAACGEGAEGTREVEPGVKPDVKPNVERGVVLRDGWARAADSGATGGAYLVLENRDTAAVTVRSVATAAAEAAEAHETMVHDGVAHMMPHASLTIAPGATLTMAPGGMHLMLQRLRRPLATGDTVALVLVLGRGADTTRAESLAVRVPVRGP